MAESKDSDKANPAPAEQAQTNNLYKFKLMMIMLLHHMQTFAE